mmetsp:Transcript_11918/g.22052  ORF Transcript_11918/g.22052 Transcript_11918/m.22052 type:complete len:433 (-) Transcript_11918:55-1353(-)|eukprot:CAMPEP_0202010268 /NCGR_PEP_ID=MMETSP0905-20130828/17334_1 /ASSEMBLY_ACC=CAM_ASM_000554 /TAXON_ID=420261 /ORGANISM="Thalassiosira antarctica, Strain CCMP982" /LENGTH=432 /DNA_ID=CAMNT_0048568867 /DNA_START=12 /DNA_END=1310 /DNA_ORIENTATION=+
MKLPTILALASLHSGDAFSNSRPSHHPSLSKLHNPTHHDGATFLSTASTDTLPTANDADTQSEQQQLSSTISKLKRVLAQEYISFFNPMVPSWYKADVMFDDPLTSLSGVDAYRKNVDMLAGRTLMGKILFDGAGINLHSVTGGAVSETNGNIEIAEIVTRWTLRVTAKILPWKPEAVFSGISVYKLQSGGKEGVTIVGQTDYWDSINIKEGMDSSIPQAQYQKVSASVAIQDFLGQLKPDGFRAVAAAPELPFELLRRGDGYELRKYPGFVGIQSPYARRDFGFGQLGAFANGMNPLAPSIMKVYNEDDDKEAKDKMMMWPLQYANPGEGSGAPSPPSAAVEKAGDGQWKSISLASQSERTVAVRTFEDAAMGPVVRNADRELRVMLKRDALTPMEGTEEFVVFSQYDAVHSMGKRRSEVWIDLEDGGHPF